MVWGLGAGRLGSGALGFGVRGLGSGVWGLFVLGIGSGAWDPVHVMARPSYLVWSGQGMALSRFSVSGSVHTGLVSVGVCPCPALSLSGFVHAGFSLLRTLGLFDWALVRIEAILGLGAAWALLG